MNLRQFPVAKAGNILFAPDNRSHINSLPTAIIISFQHIYFLKNNLRKNDENRLVML
jgi:hypothetical protein